MAQFVHVTRDEEGIALVRLDRPKANALSSAVLTELAQAARELAEDLPRAVVVTGGDRIFAAGADIAEFAAGRVGWETAAAFHAALGAFEVLPRVVIAAIEGYALGGGLELALACDLRVASRSAKLGLPEITLGLIPGGGGTQRLPRLVGLALARRMVLTGEPLGAEEARAAGLVDRVVEPGSATSEALAWARSFARGPLVAQGFAKVALNQGTQGSLQEGLALEQALFANVFATQDAATGVRSFLEHGPGQAVFAGR
jgi:enoyl-CoA hydratase/carnithine racemase